MRASVLALLLFFWRPLLEGIGSKYRVDLDILSPLLRTQFISEHDAAIFARDLRYYWEGYYDDAARIALPKH